MAEGIVMERALEALKPVEVQKADALSTEYVRQGDIFAVMAEFTTTRELKAMGAEINKRSNADTRLLGTSHTATERATLPDGTVFARGFLRHEPEGSREAEHRSRKMGDGKAWYRIVQNTVSRSFDMSQARAWSVSGRVD